MKSRLLGLLLVAFALLGPSAATAAKPIPGASDAQEVFSLEAQSARAAALVFAPERNLWFAGEATNYGPGFGIAGSLGPIDMAKPAARTEPAAKQLAQGEPLDGIALGPDGNLWMTSSAGNEILRMTPAGTVTAFPLPVGGPASADLAGPTGIVAAPDGALWFTAEAGDAIGRIDTAGQITAYPLAAGASPHAIVVGASGGLWFTEAMAGRIGAITAAGKVTTYALPNPKARPNGIATGPGGSIWFTESNSPHIGEVAATGQVAEFKAEAAGPIISGPDGDLWFGSQRGIGSISPRGVLGSTFCFDACQANVEALAIGPDHELWYAEHPVAHGGGGGNSEFTKTLPGSIGNFLTPWANVNVSPKGYLTTGGMARIPVTCGGVAEDRCRGASRLRIDGHLAGVAGFALAVGRTRDLIVRLSPWARRYVARHRKVVARLSLTVTLTLRQEVTVTLRHPAGNRGADRPG